MSYLAGFLKVILVALTIPAIGFTAFLIVISFSAPLAWGQLGPVERFFPFERPGDVQQEVPAFAAKSSVVTHGRPSPPKPFLEDILKVYKGPATERSVLLVRVYKWTDENGKTHFTDNKSKIPQKYLQQNKEIYKIKEKSSRKSVRSGL